jgi:hypothetical protein
VIGRCLILAVVIASVAAGGCGLVGGNSSDPPYTFQETLPKMVSDFGASARVADIDVSVGDVDAVVYAVIGTDGRVHMRDYRLGTFHRHHSGFTNNRQIVNSVRAATANDLRNAQVRLGDIPPGVVDKLFRKLGFRRFGGSAMLDGRTGTWTLSSDELSREYDKWEARYDGAGLHQTQSRASLFPPNVPGQARTSAPQRTGAIPNSATPSIANGQLLFACLRHAHQDITKVVACQRRYAP